MILNWPFCLPSFTVKENIKWQRGKSNPLETYVDDQTATLTMLSNAAFVVGSEYIHTHTNCFPKSLVLGCVIPRPG